MSKVALYHVGDQMESILRDLLVSEGIDVLTEHECDGKKLRSNGRLLVVVNLRGADREGIREQVERWRGCTHRVLALTDSEQTDTLVEVVSLGEWTPVRSLPDLLDEIEDWRNHTEEADFSEVPSGDFQPVDTQTMPQALLDIALDVLDATDVAVLTEGDGELFLLLRAKGEAREFGEACQTLVHSALSRLTPVWLPRDLGQFPNLPHNTAMIAWPLASQTYTHGVLMVRRAPGSPPFDDKTWTRVQVIASQLVMALDNALLTENLYNRAEALQRAEERLITMKRDEVLVRRARGMIHEVQAPIAYIQTQLRQIQEPLRALELALQKGGCSEDALRAYAEVRAHAEYADSGLARVSQVFGDLSRYSRGRQDVHFQLEAVVHAALEMSQTTAAVQLELQDVSLVGNPSQISQLLVVLLENARLAVEGIDAPPIAVRSWIAGNRAWVEVEDRGIGIPAHALGRVFEPFFTLRDPPGTGLGLSTAREIASDHGGELELYSKEGEGTLVRLSLPLPEDALNDALSLGEEEE